MAEKIMLIDGHSIINRAYYGVPLLSNADGIYTNGVYGFLNILFKLIEEEKPQYIGVAFDLSAPTFRHQQFEAYKGTRKGMPDELRMQVPILKEVLEAMGIQKFQMEGYEADDILGTLAKRAEKEGIQPVIVSGDRDLLQLATDTIKIRIPKTKQGRTEIEDYYALDVQEKYGVTPIEYIDVKALMGDPSDNIPGVPGIGEKTAIKIIQQYHSVENALEHTEEITPKKAQENLRAYKDQAILSKQLATIHTEVPVAIDIKNVKIQDILTPEAYEMFKKLEFKSLLEKFKDVKQPQAEIRVNDESSFTAIKDLNELQALVQDISDEKEFAYVIFAENKQLSGIAISYKNAKGIWIAPNEELTEADILEAAKPLFLSKEIAKIAHDGKKDIGFFRQYGTVITDIRFDTLIAAYVLNPTRDTYGYDDLAKEFLDETVPSEEEILGKGKGKKSIEDLSLEERICYTARQAWIVYRAKTVMEQKLRENEQEGLYYDIELPLVEVLADMEKHGFKIDVEKLEEYKRRLEEKIDILTTSIHDMAGEAFNINSPKQLGVILFEKLGLPAEKKTKTGYSTAADVLEKLAKRHPIVEAILEYRQLVKLKTTYADGLLAVMNPQTHKIHSSFHQTITATGRISSTEPNLQNIPIKLELGRELRKVFIPTNEEYVLLDADYSQIELRVLAHMAEDETLIRAFHEDQDIHRLTASQVFRVPFEEVTAAQRSNAKAVNFGIVYGIGAFSLSQDLGITRKEAERYIEGYFEKYPNVKRYMDNAVEEAKVNGYAKTIFNRRRVIPELASKNFALRSFGERVAMNMPIQGSAADIIKIAMVRVYHRLKEQKLRSRLILQVHDELLIETHKEEVETVKQILQYEMEHAIQMEVPLEAEVHIGDNWFESK